MFLGSYHGLNVCVPPKFNLTPKAITSHSRWGDEGGNLMCGISARIKETRKLPRPFYHVRTQPEVCGQEEGPHQSPTLLAGSLISDLQPPEEGEINFCCLEATQFVVFCYSSPNGLRKESSH